MAWYSDKHIKSTVTAEYVSKHVPRNKQQYLHNALAFGQGLTDHTYGDWIVNKSQRLFLLLQDIGCPERIFELIDQSVDDSDLPFPRDDIQSLGLGNANLETKFYNRQFAFKVRPICRGNYIDYEDEDVVPLAILERSKGQSSKLDSDYLQRVSVEQTLLTKWRISLSARNDRDKRNLTSYYQTIQTLSHPNLVSLFATYSHNNQAYILLEPCLDMNLKTFLEEPPKSFKQMAKADQLALLLQWIRCLVGAVAYMHENGWAHQAIRPSNIFLTGGDKIVLGPHAAMGALEEKSSTVVKEVYQFGAPEQWERLAPWANSVPVPPSAGIRSVSASHINLYHSRSSSSGSLSSQDGEVGSTQPTKRSHPFRKGSISSLRAASGSTPSNSLKTASSFPSNVRPSLANLRKGSLPSDYRQRTYATTSAPRSSRSSIIFSSTPFQSDIFSLFAVIIELLSFFTSICRSSTKFSSTSLRSHLSKGNRGGDSFHGNLTAVHSWLDSLIQLHEPKDDKKLSKIITRNLTNTKSTWVNRNDLDHSRYLGALSSFVRLARHGIERRPSQRLSSTDSLSQINEILRIWSIPTDTCACFDQIKPADPVDDDAGPESAVSSLSSNSVTSTPHLDKSISPGSSQSTRGFPEPASPEPAFDPDYQLPALTYSPSPRTASIHLPSRPPTPPPKDVFADSPLEKSFNSKAPVLIVNVDTTAIDHPWLPPTPTSTLFHPTVYELAASVTDSEIEDLVHEAPDMDYLTLPSLDEGRGYAGTAMREDRSWFGDVDHNREMAKSSPQRDGVKKKAHKREQTVIIAIDTQELSPVKQAHPTDDQLARPNTSQGFKAEKKRPSLSNLRSESFETRNKTTGLRKGSEGGHRLRAERSAINLGQLSRSMGSEETRRNDTAQEGETWWGLEWGKWRKGQNGWRPVVGKREHEARLGRVRGASA